MEYTMSQLNEIAEKMQEAASKQQSYTISSPSEFASLIEEYIRVRKERDAYEAEHGKLVEVLETMYNMSEAVNEMAVKIRAIIDEN